MSRFGIQAFSLNNVQYPGASGWQYDAGRSVDASGLDGLQFETMQHEVQMKPSADITTRSLKDVLVALNDSTDLPLKALDASNGLKLIAAKAASGAPGYASGTVHIQRQFLRGLIYVAGVRWAKGSKAEMMLRALAKGTGDGLTDAVGSTLVTNPTQPTPDFGFTLSALTLNGASIPTPDSLDLSIEPNFEHDYLAGLPVPTDIIGAGVRSPLVVALRADIGDLDIGSGTGAVVAVFKRYANGGGFGTDTVTFTLNGVWTAEEGVGGDSNSPGARSLLVRTRWNGSTKPLTWATA